MTTGRGSPRRGGELLRVEWGKRRRRRLSVFIHAKGYLGHVGLCWSGAVGPVVGLVGGLRRLGKVQVAR